MYLNGEEFEQDREALKREVLDELKREALKKEIVAELQTADRPFSFSKFAQHPALLLLLGFILTSGFGTWLAYYWQSKEWSRQQAQIAQQSQLEQKYKIIEEVIKAVSETKAAAEDVLIIFDSPTSNKKLSKELPERRNYWQNQGSRNWRISAPVLPTKLKFNFNNPEAQSVFDQISLKRRFLGNAINLLIVNYEKDNRFILDPSKLRKGGNEKLIADIEIFNGKRRHAKQLIDELEELLAKLVEIMLKDIQPAGELDD